MTKPSKALATVLRVLLAALFLVSSLAKLLAIDDFELYIFSYGFLSLNVSYIAARLCIVAEFLLGLFIALGWWRRWVNLLTLAMLFLFSIFLCYAALVGRTDSCQCMGRLVELDPAQSLLKNAVLIVLALMYSRWSAWEEKAGVAKTVLTAVFVLGVTAGVFCISVPDNWMFGPEESRYNKELLEETIAPEGLLAADSLTTGNHLVAFVTPGCPYCKMARQKIGSIAQRNHLDTTRIHYYEPADLGDTLFLRITFGQRPFIVMLADGEPDVTYHYRNINERQITKSLRK